MWVSTAKGSQAEMRRRVYYRLVPPREKEAASQWPVQPMSTMQTTHTAKERAAKTRHDTTREHTKTRDRPVAVAVGPDEDAVAKAGGTRLRVHLALGHERQRAGHAQVRPVPACACGHIYIVY